MSTETLTEEMLAEQEDEDTLKDKFLTFHIAEEDFGIADTYLKGCICIK